MSSTEIVIEYKDKQYTVDINNFKNISVQKGGKKKRNTRKIKSKNR